MKKIMLGASILFLAGCGGRAPIRRAQEILFEVPYIQQKQQYESVSVGVKKLSIPEIKELFCDSDTLLKTYNVYYVRTHNNGNETYFMHVADQPLPTRKEIESFFNPHTTMHTIAHVLFIVPAGIGLSLLAPDPLSYFVGFAGLNIGLHIAEAQSLGVEDEDAKQLNARKDNLKTKDFDKTPCSYSKPPAYRLAEGAIICQIMAVKQTLKAHY
jgi:hypothetical protein